MKSIISKILITGAIVTTFGLNLQARSVRPMLADTGKMGKMSRMSKMDKKADKKMDKKMARGKMVKDTGKMDKM
ncbi:hypothetical protein [Mucilaginibacter sp. UR6-11]|uniref:hypothetical protein n=1 Tax=Mucilaginibacter sp. UR6-11 TaxID=1435644 RepID=UPI001E35E57A|nr:hypothetical protein [Mucilaginibacter sp. UR6-11]MCC8424445.1 hypothetical protein [Mucilaginibacter sp. UR6-11]